MAEHNETKLASYRSQHKSESEESTLEENTDGSSSSDR